MHAQPGFETFCHEWAMRCGESKDLVHTMRQRLGHTWLAWSLLRWRDENASRAGEPLPFEPLSFTSDEQLDATLLEQCQGRDASGRLKPECLLSRFTAFWAGEHASRCLKPVPGSSTCDCYIIDRGHSGGMTPPGDRSHLEKPEPRASGPIFPWPGCFLWDVAKKQNTELLLL